MRPKDITCVVCVLCFCSGRSEAHQPQNCSGWFGPRCQYKCRCTGEKCLPDGQCMDNAICEGGWFGPACQYADLAYNTAINVDIVDNNEQTCLSNNAQEVTIVLKEHLPFTWLRVTVADKGSAFLKDLSVSFRNTSSEVACPNKKLQYVNNKTLDVHCTLQGLTKNVTLKGKATGYLCSVFISGGRNVALKENATQDTTFREIRGTVLLNFTADKAVDGSRGQHLYQGLGCSHTADDQDQISCVAWRLVLSRPRRVNRFVIYNRLDGEPYVIKRLQGFRLDYFDTTIQRNQGVDDASSTQAKENYTVTIRPTSIKNITVSVNQTDKVVTLCEFEVYGDTVCDSLHFGFECELECRCHNGSACFDATGGCPSLCPAGLHGPNCSRPCNVGAFGLDCLLPCPPGCSGTGKSTTPECDRITGLCVKGCKPGFLGEICDERCVVGRFGANCSLSCSPKCEASLCSPESGACVLGCKSGFGATCSLSCSPGCVADKGTNTVLCNHNTGACIDGCKPGFSGATCVKASSRTLEIIVGLCLLLCALVFILYCLCKKKRTPPKEEMAGGNLQPLAENAEM